jgi:hypothetical protein
LLTWFIAIGAVLTLGAVAGVVWERRRSARHHCATPPSARDLAALAPARPGLDKAR